MNRAVVFLFVAACGAPARVDGPHVPPAARGPRSVPLPGATGPVTVDLVGTERARSRVWIPVGDTGSVDVFDAAASTFTRVDGFKTAERESRGKKRMMGPSSVTFGDGVAYVGDRASSEVCVVDEATLALGACVTLPTPPDGLAYVAKTREVWVTTPKGHTVTVLDASTPRALTPKLVIATDGDPEGYAVDDARGVFYTNLEDKNQTLVIDLASHAIKATWPLSCSDGPRGIAADHARALVYVACTDGVSIRTTAGDALAQLDTGDGVDDIAYVEATQRLYVAAGKAARLTIAHVDDAGRASVVSSVQTCAGCRNATVDARGATYVVDPQAARLLVFDP